MSEMIWKISEEHQIRDFIITQDIKFQKAMRTELRELAREKGIKVVWKQDAVRDPTPIVPSLDKTLLVPADQWKTIFEEVCQKHNVPPILIRGKQRAPYIVKARCELAWRLAHETSMSLPQIASKMGYADHSVLYHCFRRYKEEHGL